MTVVIGIDPAISGFHGAAIHVENDTLLLFCSQHQPEPKVVALRSAALCHVADDLWRFMTLGRGWLDDADEVPYVFVEEPIVAGARNLRTALMLAEAVGAIVGGTGKFTDKCYLVPVPSWKKGTVGTGNASKQEVALWLSRLHPSYAHQCDGSQDLTDACCIALYGTGVVADAALVRTIGSAE